MLQNIRSILIGVTEEGDAQERSSALAYGLSLAREAGAHVTVQAASLKLTLTHAFVSSFAEQLVNAENRRLDALARGVADFSERAAAASGLACTTQAPQLAYPDLIKSFTALARTHDLTVLDSEPISLAVDRGLIEAVLMDSGRPLITVPDGCEAFSGKRIIVAWDGSAKAARALNDALPILRAASQVELIGVTGEKDLTRTVPGVEIAPHLARHGINVNVLTLPAQNGDVAETLRNHAHLTRADMIVMGAYVHSRFRQLMLGGTTQSLLKNCPVPLFLSY
ncbi:nucleotide-binding universal stress UspA family protein [Microvirga flocculans]|uniref:Nucleotide-binding universal stress UspA family protein n=1 Tax=Microvirga flocculans TaxID=217168 RepID=A0A7W6N6E4_9HYPH|nr:universal stress protein [Microvirga flocculans]MBB4038492.1 nucleotide-binding universal stress UspA family protein [Microvirga flocculans]